MADTLDPTSYLRTPRLNVRSALSLGKMLLQLVPKPGNAAVKRKAVALRNSVAALEDAFRRSNRGGPVNDPRPYDLRLDRLWTAVRDRLAAYEALSDGDEYRARAMVLMGELFADGLAFLKLPYVDEHAESQRRLTILDEGDNAANLDELVDPLFVAELRDAHAAYGEALGITKAGTPVAATVTTIEPLRAVAQAITAYCLQVLAFSNDDDGNEAIARRALEPIDRIRRDQARRARAVGEIDDTIEDEVPPDSPMPPLTELEPAT